MHELGFSSRAWEICGRGTAETVEQVACKNHQQQQQQQQQQHKQTMYIVVIELLLLMCLK